MALYIGTNEIDNLAVGSNEIDKMYLGQNVIWEKGRNVIYGFKVDPTISDPYDAVTYLAKAVGKTPAAMGNSTFSYGSWEKAFFMPKPCMLKYDGTVDYYLDPNDYTKKIDGTSSDVGNTSYNGNAMMEWGKIWFKFEQDINTGEGYFYCSDYEVDSTYHCWCNYDANDNEIPNFYTPIYNFTIVNSKGRSLSGLALTAANGANSKTATQEATAAHNCNTTSTIEWETGVWCDWTVISALLVLMGKSLDIASVFGVPYTSTVDDYVTGTLNNKGIFWGDLSNGNLGVKVFGMENFYGVTWKRIAGLITEGGNGYYYKMTFGTSDGSTTTGYNYTRYVGGYINQPFMPVSGNGYIKKMMFGNYGMLTTEIGGSNSTYYCANFVYGSNGHGYCLIGADNPFNIYVGGDYDWTSSGYAGTLSCKPILRNP